jgi:hypothetical protein
MSLARIASFSRVAEAIEISHESVLLLLRERSLADVPAGLWLDRVDDSDPVVRCVLRRGSDGLTKIQPEGTPPNGGKQRHPEPASLLASTPRHTPALAGLQIDKSRFAASHWLRDFLADGSEILPSSLISTTKITKMNPRVDIHSLKQ